MCGPGSRAQDARGLGGDGVVLAFSVFAKTNSRPCVVRPASLRAGFFLLLVQEKETKEKDNPASAPSAHPARKVRERRPVAPTAHPCADGARSAIHRAPPSGRFGHRPPPLKGPGKAKSSALLRAEARARFLQGGCFCGQEGRASAFPGSLLAAASARRKGPQGRRDGSRRVCRQRKEALSANPGARSRSFARRSARNRGREGAVSLGSFSLGKQREGTGPQGCGTNRTRMWIGFRKNEKQKTG